MGHSGGMLIAACLGTFGLSALWFKVLGPRVERRLMLWKGVEIVKDLDAILTRTVGVQLHGRLHRIPPIPVEKFFQAMNALAEFDKIRTSENSTPEDLLRAYEGIFAVVCPTITRKVIEGMSQQQVASLYDTVIEQIMGQKRFSAEKKSSEKPTETTSPKRAV